MSRNVIRDGQTRQGRIDPIEGLYDELDFGYRPMLAEDVEQLEADASAAKTARDGVQLTADATATQLETWSEATEKGEPLPPVFENVRRLPFSQLNKLYRIVAGMAPTDPIPNARGEEMEERFADLRRRAAGETQAEAEERSAKNSETG